MADIPKAIYRFAAFPWGSLAALTRLGEDFDAGTGSR